MLTSALALPVRNISRNRRKLPLASDANLRIAQISRPGVLFDNASYLPPAQLQQLQLFRPQVLIGSVEDLRDLASQSERSALKFSDLDRAAFVLTDFRCSLLDDVTRALLWEAFSVPLYELVLAEDGALLAFECEAHSGWHLESRVVLSEINGALWYRCRRGPLLATGLTAQIEDRPCDCGRAGRRILNAALDFRDPLRLKLANIA
jgi:hypothetical protein